MRTKDYIEKNKCNIQHLVEIERVLEELRPIRGIMDGGNNKVLGTNKYHSDYLTSDWRYKKFVDNNNEDKWNGIDISDRKFIYNDGEIKRDIAASFRNELLTIVRDDKSYGYIYFLLQSAQNRITGFGIECVYNHIAILEAINFCWEDLLEHIETLKTISEKILYIEDKKTLWEQDDNYKKMNRNVTSFGEKCHAEIQKLERLKEFQQSNGGFQSTLSTPCLIEIHAYLSKKLLTTSKANWLAWFGRNNNQRKKMVWNDTPNKLANTIKKLCVSENVPVTFQAFGINVGSPDKTTKFNSTTIGSAIENIIKKYS